MGIVEKVKGSTAEYAPGEDRPLGAYAGGIAVYSTLVGLGALTARLQHRTPPELSALDVVVLGLATHKIARLISKENITSALRAPFMRYSGPGGPAELHEEVRGSGAQHAVGELISCPFCLAQWSASALGMGMVFAPGATRAVATTMSAVAISDFLQLGYAWMQRQAAGG